MFFVLRAKDQRTTCGKCVDRAGRALLRQQEMNRCKWRMLLSPNQPPFNRGNGRYQEWGKGGRGGRLRKRREGREIEETMKKASTGATAESLLQRMLPHARGLRLELSGTILYKSKCIPCMGLNRSGKSLKIIPFSSEIRRSKFAVLMTPVEMAFLSLL